MSYIDSKLTREEFIQHVYNKGKSVDAKHSAITAIHSLDYYSRDQYGKDSDVVLNDILNDVGQDKKALKLLHDFVAWLSEDHVEILNGKEKPIKAKRENSIKSYLGLSRKYMRLCHGIKVDLEDIKDFVSVPRDDDESEPEPLTKSELIRICDEAKPLRKTFYMVMKDTGARMKEVLQLKKKNFDFTKTPVLVTFPRAITKGRRATRYQYLTRETAPRVKLLLKDRDDEARVFGSNDDMIPARSNEISAFNRLTQRLGLNERYPNGRRKKSIHAIRAFTSSHIYNYTKDDHLAHAYIGHTRYLQQYLRKTEEERASEFLEFEDSLMIYESKQVVTIDSDERIGAMEKQLELQGRIIAELQKDSHYMPNVVEKD